MTGKTYGPIGGVTMGRLMTLALVSVGAVTLAACSGGGSATSATTPAAGSGPSALTAPPQTPNSGGQAASTPTGAATPAPEGSTRPDMGEPRVRFAAGGTEIIVRIADNPTSRDFVSMLPLTLDFEDFAGMEKLGYLPRRLTTEGSSGSAPANGDLIYFVPWGNLGFFYNAERRDPSYDDRVIPIGTVEAGYERLDNLETGPVSAELIR